jgi:hypothetical protein
VGAAAFAVGFLAGTPADGAARTQDCTAQTAWAGVEPQNLAGVTVEQWPTTEEIRVTSVTISWAYAPIPAGASDQFREALMLAGASDQPLPTTPGIPTFADAAGWGTPSWQAPAGAKVGGNSQIAGGVFAARILKSAGGSNAGNDAVTVPVDRVLPAGGVLWVFLGAATSPFDVEAQMVASYVPASCG